MGDDLKMRHTSNAEGIGVQLRPARLTDAVFFVWLHSQDHVQGRELARLTQSFAAAGGVCQETNQSIGETQPRTLAQTASHIA